MKYANAISPESRNATGRVNKPMSQQERRQRAPSGPPRRLSDHERNRISRRYRKPEPLLRSVHHEHECRDNPQHAEHPRVSSWQAGNSWRVARRLWGCMGVFLSTNLEQSTTAGGDPLLTDRSRPIPAVALQHRRRTRYAFHFRDNETSRNRGGTTMAEARKVIITCAITGSIHTPSMSPHLPVTPREIADAAVAAAEAGAAIVHLHARDPVDGHPTQDPKYFREFAPDIKRRSNVVHQLHDRRRRDDDDRGTPAAGAAVEARGRVAQHGLDELRALPDAQALQGVQVRLGARVPGGPRTRGSSATRSRISSTS